MPRPNPKFTIGLGVTITNLLDSTRPKYFKYQNIRVGLAIATQIVAKPSLPLSNKIFESIGYDQRLGLGGNKRNNIKQKPKKTNK
jgi:hypothetical protein